MEQITITIADMDSGDSTSRPVPTMSKKVLKEAIMEFEEDSGYRKYELMCEDIVEDSDILEVLDDLNVTY